MGAYLSIILQAVTVGEALPGAIENTLVILTRLRRVPGKRCSYPV